MSDEWIETTLAALVDQDGVLVDGDWVESKDQDEHGTHRLLQLADVGIGEFLNKSNRWMNEEQFSRLSCTSLEPNDLLIARMPDPIARGCLVPEGLGTCATVVDVAVVRTGNRLLQQFLKLIVNDSSFRSGAMGLSTGTTRKRISRSKLSQIPFLLPPPPVQRRIVDLMTHLDAHIANLRTEQEALDVARGSLVEDLLNHVEGNDRRLGECLDIARGGSPRPIDDFLTGSPNGLNWIKIGDVSATGKFITNTAQKIRPEGLSKTRRVNIGDFLLSNSMSFGRPYILRIDGCIHDGWLVLSDRDGVFDQDFLYNLLRSQKVQTQFTSLAAGSGVKNLNISVVQTVTVKVPSLEKQRAIAATINTWESAHESLTAELQTLEVSRQGLLMGLLTSDIDLPSGYDALLQEAS